MESSMVYLIIIVIIIVIVVLIFSKKKPQKMESKERNTEKKEPRDYFQNYSHMLNLSLPLSQMLSQDRSGTINFLIECLNSRSYNPKAVAFLLGQIGDKTALDPLWNAISNERTGGNKEAMEAAVVAIQYAPADEGYTELQRREVIDGVYHKRSFSKPKLNQNITEVQEENKIETNEEIQKAWRLFATGAAKNFEGKYEEAIEYYKKAINIRPNYTDAYLEMGVAYDNLGNYYKAIEYCQKAL